jgi:hypothetical protein
MRFRHAPFALALAALPAVLAAEPWEKVDELPGGIAVELDRDSVFETLDGATLVWRGVFRRENVGWTMETHVAIDCERELAKIRGMRLLDGAEVLTERPDLLAEFLPINAGSSEAIYYKALCGRPASIEAALPEAMEEDAGIDLPPGEEAVAEDPGIDLVPAEAEPDFGELFGELPLEDAPAGASPE